MRVEDLMIGDWVNVFDIPKQIEGIRKFRNGDEIVYYDGDNGNYIKSVTPIPLTPEILEKNGWYLDEIDGNYRHQNNGFWIGGKNAPFGILISNLYQDINYIHEFQHALKLCKIEKEIIL